LGSLGKRKKTVQGKLNAMFTREITESCKRKEMAALENERSVNKSWDMDEGVIASTQSRHQQTDENKEERVAEAAAAKTSTDNYESDDSGYEADTELRKIQEGGKVSKRRRRNNKKTYKKRANWTVRNPPTLPLPPSSLPKKRETSQELVADARISAKGGLTARVSRKYI